MADEVLRDEDGVRVPVNEPTRVGGRQLGGGGGGEEEAAAGGTHGPGGTAERTGVRGADRGAGAVTGARAVTGAGEGAGAVTGVRAVAGASQVGRAPRDAAAVRTTASVRKAAMGSTTSGSRRVVEPSRAGPLHLTPGRVRATWVSGVAACLVAALLVAGWLVADAVVPRGAGVTDPAMPGRMGPVVRGMAWPGVPVGALLVGAAVRAAARRWRVALAVAGVTAALLWAHAIWADHVNRVVPWETAHAALLPGFVFAAPLTGLIAAFTAWVAADPLGRPVPWRPDGRRVPVAVALPAAATLLLWGFVVRPWNRIRDIGGHEDDNGNLLWLLIVAATLLVTGTGWVAARLTLRPVEAMRGELADITARSLDRRVPVPALGGVLHRLARTLNATLDRLQASADRQHRFVADASHELRSPVAGLRASLESALTHPDGVDWPHTVRGTLADIERIQHLTDDLLLLTRIDGPAPHEDEKVRLDDLASDLVEEYRHLRRNSGLHVTCDAPAARLPALTGSSLRLERLLRNLLDNACRHARTEVEVVLAVDDAGWRVRVEVRDDGPGIPPADRDRVFERFTRLDASRTRRADTGGAGLGLAIAREIAARQGGELYVADGPGPGPGAVLVAEFPVVRPEEADPAEQLDRVPKSRRGKVSWVAVASVAVTVALLATGFADTVRNAWTQVETRRAVPSVAPGVRAPVDALHPVATLLHGGTSVNVHLYAPARTEAEAWAQLAAIRKAWPGVLPGGAVRTPGAKLPYGIGSTLFVAGLREEDGSGVLAHGALPAPGKGATRTAAVLVPEPGVVSGRHVELVLGWAPPTVGAVSYRWDDGTVKWPELQKVLGSDRRWFLAMGAPGAKSKGYDTYDLADRHTVGTR